MLPTELIVGPLATASITFSAVFLLLALVGRSQTRADANEVATKGNVLLPREKARMLPLAQAFCLGISCALFGAILLINHKGAAYSNAYADQSTQKVR